MKCFPKISRQETQNCFDRVSSLFSGCKEQLINAAALATIGKPRPIVYSTTKGVDTQIGEIRQRVGLIGEREGQNVLIGILESLWEELLRNSLPGVTTEGFFNCTRLDLGSRGSIEYSMEKQWLWCRNVNLDNEEVALSLSLRGKGLSNEIIVPEYVVANLQQAISAFHEGKFGACLSLASISLESTLRDALVIKGYTYAPHVPAKDVYSKSDIHISRLPTGYSVSFPTAMPRMIGDFLASSTDPTHIVAKIKRIKHNEKFVLQLENVDGLVDYWSSDSITARGTKIGGLGKALQVARNDEDIIDTTIFPMDLDKPISDIRNNLIHLSGDAMSKEVYELSNGKLTLEQYLENKELVFDALSSIINIVNDLYFKIASRTL